MCGKERNTAFMFDRKKYQQGLERHDRISMFGWTIPLNNQVTTDHGEHIVKFCHQSAFHRLKDALQTV